MRTRAQQRVFLKRLVALLDKVAATVAVLSFGVFVTGQPEQFVWGAVGLVAALATWGVATWIATEFELEADKAKGE